MALDGSYGTASDYSSGIEAYTAAQVECTSKTMESCDQAIAAYTALKSGDMYIVGLWCDEEGRRSYVMANGKTPSKVVERVQSALFGMNFQMSQCKKRLYWI